jgi:hypothetical protein
VVSKSEIVTEIDEGINDLYLQCDDAGLAKCISLVSGGCQRSFPLSDDSLAKVCILSLIGLLLVSIDSQSSKRAFSETQDTLVGLLSSKLSIAPSNNSDRKALAFAFLEHWDPFERKLLRIKDVLGMSEMYFDALADDIDSRAYRVRLHYGVAKGDEVYV